MIPSLLAQIQKDEFKDSQNVNSNFGWDNEITGLESTVLDGQKATTWRSALQTAHFYCSSI